MQFRPKDGGAPKGSDYDPLGFRDVLVLGVLREESWWEPACSPVRLTSEWSLAAAHCVTDRQGRPVEERRLSVFLSGDYNPAESDWLGQRVRPVNKNVVRAQVARGGLAIHPKYVPPQPDAPAKHDLALVRAPGLPPSRTARIDREPPGTVAYATLAGWGWTNVKGDPNDPGRALNVGYATIPGGMAPDPDGTVSVDFAPGSAGLCLADSGGPLFAGRNEGYPEGEGEVHLVTAIASGVLLTRAGRELLQRSGGDLAVQRQLCNEARSVYSAVSDAGTRAWICSVTGEAACN
jgi:hypothetical protein